MGTDGNLVLHRQANGLAHQFSPAGMVSTGNIGRTDQGHDQCIGCKALAHVAVQVNLPLHVSNVVQITIPFFYLNSSYEK
jgi:hypothetical protein